MRARTCAGVPLGACITLPGPPPIGMFWGPVGASIVLPGPPPIGGAPLYAVVAPPPPEVPPPGTMPVGDCIVMPGPPPIGAVPIGGTAPTGTEGPPAASAAGTGEGLLSGFGASADAIRGRGVRGAHWIGVLHHAHNRGLRRRRKTGEPLPKSVWIAARAWSARAGVTHFFEPST